MAMRVTVRLNDELEAYAKASGLPIATAIRELAMRGLRSSEETSLPTQASSNQYKEALLGLTKILAETTDADVNSIYEILNDDAPKKTSQKKKSTKAIPQKSQETIQEVVAEVPSEVQPQKVEPVVPREPIAPKEPIAPRESVVITPTQAIAATPIKTPLTTPLAESNIGEDDSEDISINEDTNAPISDDVMASLNEMLGIL